MFNDDYSDMLSAFAEEGVEYMVVGAFAVAAYGLPRATGDMDLWVRPTPENAERITRALQRFGASMAQISASDFVTPEIVFQIGVAPRRIDILTSIAGVTFDEAWPVRTVQSVGGTVVNVISRDHLIANKRAAGRPKDRADVRALQRRMKSGG
jgi:hypothetical protein